MMLALLARTAAEFDKQLRTTLPGEPERERYRAQIGNSLFLQLLVGMKGERIGVNAFLMGLIALITIVLAPLATLVLMQMMFLPYHHLRITWWHRAIVVADLALIVVMTYRCFFPRGVRKAPLVLGALSRKPRWATAMAFCVLLGVVLWPTVRWLSFEQGRWAGEPRTSSWPKWAQWMVGKPPPFAKVVPDYDATEHGVVFGWFPDRLELESETIVGKEKWEKAKEEIASRKGAKEAADKDLAHTVDFVPTIKLDERDLQAADLSGADLRGVSLNGAVILGANLSLTRLDGARLEGARLQDADLEQARLQGANLNEAELQGVDLLGAHLQGADLSDAELQNADLRYAFLQGANLNEAELQGVDLLGAQLQGTDLRSAQLQGADLSDADLSDAEVDRTFVFRTDFADANLATAAIRPVHADQVKPDEDDKIEPIGQADVVRWIRSATQFAAEEDKDAIKKRFGRLKLEPPFQTAEQDTADAAKWDAVAKQSQALDPDGAHHRRRMATILGDLACGADSADGAPSVARSLVRQPQGIPGRLADLGDQLDAVRERMEAGRKTLEKCPGVAGFTEDDWSALNALKPD
jgi:uncharacterized protein YjbI with pentapeptide repeats